jgi:hypothetical protein
MNLPARLNTAAAQLDQPSGAPAAHQLQLALQQTAASAGALSQPAQAQAMVAQQRAMDEAGTALESRANLASQFLLGKVADLKRMTGVLGGSEQLAALGANSPQELLARIGMG